MRILMLTQVYWPEERSAPRNLAAFAEALQERGHEVSVITGFPNHPFGRLYEGYRVRWRQWEDVRGVRVLRVPLYPDHSLSILRRGCNYASFALSAATVGAWLTRRFRPDVLFVYLPPLTNWLPIRILEFIHRMPVVYWESDLWPDVFAATGTRPGAWLERAIEALDRAVHRRAKAVCVNSPGFVKRMEEKGVDSSQLEVITDWADDSLFHPVRPDRELATVQGLEGRFNVIYGGNFGPAQDLTTVLEAAGLLGDLAELQVVLIGGGEEEERLRAMAREKRLFNVKFIERQPMADIHRFYALADVLIAHLRPERLFEFQIPSKIMAYLACGRPILCAIGGSAAEVVEDAGGGVVSPPGDPEAMASAIRRLYEMQPDEREAIGTRGRRAYLAKYTLKVQVKRLEAILSRAAGVV